MTPSHEQDAGSINAPGGEEDKFPNKYFALCCASHRRRDADASPVIAGLDPAIHEAVQQIHKDVARGTFIMDARVKPAHDAEDLADNQSLMRSISAPQRASFSSTRSKPRSRW